MLTRTHRGSASRLMMAVAIALAIVQASAMALANAACCCRMAMTSGSPCPMHADAGAAMPAHHHHEMDGMATAESAPVAPGTCRFSCSALSSASIFVTPGVPALAPVSIVVMFVAAPAPIAADLPSLDLARVPHAPPPRA